MALTFHDVQAARERIAPYAVKTPLLRLHALDDYLGCQVYVKAECMQVTGSFKYRGAMNKILSLTKEELGRGIVAASSGNHGKALAYAAKMLGVKATIVLPYTAAQIKVDTIAGWGAETVRCEVQERFEVAERICRSGARPWCRPTTTSRSWPARARRGWSSWSSAPNWTRWWSPPAAAGSSGACLRR